MSARGPARIPGAVVGLGIALSAGCAGAAARSERASSPNTMAAVEHPADGAPSMLSLCEAVVAGDQGARAALAAHPSVAKMASGMSPQVVFSPEEFAAAAFAKTDDPRFSFARLRRSAPFIRPFAERMRRDQNTLVAAALVRASELLAVTIEPSSIPVHFVCGSPWDAFVLIFERSELFFDLGYYADREVDAAVAEFEPILTHELWHLAFIEHQKQHWRVDYRSSAEPRAAFFYRALNEGVGHYYSLRPKLGPPARIDDLDAKIDGAFARLGPGYERYLATADAAERQRVLWSSHAGVPFWEKWSAVPTAIMVHRLLAALGPEHVRDLISAEPFSLFLAYQDTAPSHPHWQTLPPALIEDARALLEAHAQR